MQSESATKFRAKSPTAEDWCQAEQVTQLVFDQLKLDMKAPAVKQQLLDANFESVMPFFAKNQFVAPFALASKAPFASNKNFSFLHVEDTASNSSTPATQTSST